MILPGDTVIIHESAWDLAASAAIIGVAVALLAIVIVGSVRHIWLFGGKSTSEKGKQ